MKLFCTMANPASVTYLMYLTGQHPIVPAPALVKHITHVALAFMRPGVFNVQNQTEWPLFTTVEDARKKFCQGTKVLVAIGGWGDTEGFEEAAKTEVGRRRFAENVGRMVDETGADGVDIDWEYPGGNGEDYKTVPNTSKAWQITAYPPLLSEIRAVLGPHKLISAAVPGLPRDMLAFTAVTIPLIEPHLDFFNIMTYDLMNRRDNVTKHHTGLALSLQAMKAYIENGVPARKANLGFALYVKWFKTSSDPAAVAQCEKDPIACPTALMEDPISGADLGKAGAFAYDDNVPEELKESWERAQNKGKYDEVNGGWYYWDEGGLGEEGIWWSWDTEEAIRRKIPFVLELGYGGVFAWGLGEDGPDWRHVDVMNKGVKWLRKVGEGEGEKHVLGEPHVELR